MLVVFIPFWFFTFVYFRSVRSAPAWSLRLKVVLSTVLCLQWLLLLLVQLYAIFPNNTTTSTPIFIFTLAAAVLYLALWYRKHFSNMSALAYGVCGIAFMLVYNLVVVGILPTILRGISEAARQNLLVVLTPFLLQFLEWFWLTMCSRTVFRPRSAAIVNRLALTLLEACKLVFLMNITAFGGRLTNVLLGMFLEAQSRNHILYRITSNSRRRLQQRQAPPMQTIGEPGDVTYFSTASVTAAASGTSAQTPPTSDIPSLADASATADAAERQDQDSPGGSKDLAGTETGTGVPMTVLAPNPRQEQPASSQSAPTSLLFRLSYFGCKYTSDYVPLLTLLILITGFDYYPLPSQCHSGTCTGHTAGLLRPPVDIYPLVFLGNIGSDLLTFVIGRTLRKLFKRNLLPASLQLSWKEGEFLEERVHVTLVEGWIESVGVILGCIWISFTSINEACQLVAAAQ
eukprot:TRINITY_DN985_c0_g1_i18.p1 TRINITY_DN985_c0_g1~~TRINITY_DN985_c0_g1_i18.p1  ORF type:complete len:458 (+),score=88.07 TRINITY_DN985_c0_g1_i18:853-2226(+)